MTQILISLINKCAQGIGFVHQRDTVALLSLFCARSGADAEGSKQQDWRGSAGHVALVPARFLR